MIQKSIFIIITTISFLCLFHNKLPAQVWAPSGAEWYYEYNNFWVTGYVQIVYTGDTLINDNSSSGQIHNCQTLTKTFFSYNYENYEFDTISLGNEYTYSNNDTVFIYRSGTFYVLFDFSAQVGDSWIIPWTYETMCDSTGLLNVISIGDTIINNEEFRYIYVEPNNTSGWIIQGLIIERIGPIMHYMLPEQNCMTDLLEGGPLRCYNDDFFQFNTGIASYCDYVVRINESSRNELVVCPNPATGSIEVHCPDQGTYELILRSLKGTNSLQFHGIKGKTLIDISTLPSGFYVLSLIDYKSNTINTKLQILKK